jgi:hypothetical protein
VCCHLTVNAIRYVEVLVVEGLCLPWHLLQCLGDLAWIFGAFLIFLFIAFFLSKIVAIVYNNIIPELTMMWNTKTQQV